jgi:hypothetical protein
MPNHKRMPKEYMDVAPVGKLLASLEGHPEGLLAIPNTDGSPRIIVPRSQILALVLQTHEDIHHQSHVKVLYILKPLFYCGNDHGHRKYLHGLSNLYDGIS